jgi:hypothetical protein
MAASFALAFGSERRGDLCPADSRKFCRSAGNQTAAVEFVGSGSAGGGSRVRVQRISFSWRSIAGAGDDQAATGVAVGGVVAFVGGE